MATISATRNVVADLESRRTTVSYRAQCASGVARARNAGAERARGKVLIFLDDDILVERDHIVIWPCASGMATA